MEVSYLGRVAEAGAGPGWRREEKGERRGIPWIGDSSAISFSLYFCRKGLWVEGRGRRRKLQSATSFVSFHKVSGPSIPKRII
jgi:hypothetical protein